jgi:maltose/moltooligosaccharide transporter
MKQLAWVLFSWFAFFHVDLHRQRYTTHFGTTDTTSEAYNTGANQVGEMFANYNNCCTCRFFATIGKI